jgi:hypothetical protein
VRSDRVARALDVSRWQLGVSPYPAVDLRGLGTLPVPGSQVARAYGLLAHYATWDHLLNYLDAGEIGPSCWLSPTAYSACMVPYGLGLPTPRDVCLLVDVSQVGDLYGPGTCPASIRHPFLWRGGGIEFYSPQPISIAFVKEVVELEPCGDTHP